MIIYLTILVLINAFVDYVQIKKGLHIFHGWETIAYFAACTPLILFFPFWKILILSITARGALFDIALNLLRGKNWLYNGVGASIIDRIENRLKISPIWLRIGGIILFIIATIFI